MTIHHIGYLVKNLNRALDDFGSLGFICEDLSSKKPGEEKNASSAPCVSDNIRKVNITFMKNGPYRIELVEPINKDSPIYGLLKKYKNSPYHICYSVSNLDNEIIRLEKMGWVLFEAPEIAPAINNCKVAFLMSASSGMIELVEDKS